MKLRFAGLLLALLALFAYPTPPAKAQAVPPAGQSRLSNEWVASNFGRWTLRVYTGGGGASTSYTISFPNGGYVNAAGAQQFTPFTLTTRITVGIGTTQETVTPTAISGCGISSTGICNVTASFTYAHGVGTPVISGSGGFDEAVNVAHANGGGTVLVDGTTGITDAIIEASTALYANVSVQSLTGQVGPTLYNLQPSTLSALSTPTPRVGTASQPCTGSNTVCDGTAVGTWTNAAVYFCVTYVDIAGQESPCSTTAHYTTAGSLALNFLPPAASTGAVGWKAYAGAAYATAYMLPITSSVCTVTTLETVNPACAITNTAYGQVGSLGVFPTPTTTTALLPVYTVATYDPTPLSHNAFQYQPHHGFPICGGLPNNYGPWPATAGGTTTQVQVIATIELPSGCLNQIGKTIHVYGKIALTTGTSETPALAIELGPTWTTGTPTSVCSLANTTAETAAANGISFSCTITTQATGSSGTIQPNGWMIRQLQAGTTAGAASVDLATAAITDNLAVSTNGTPQDMFVVYTGTSGTSTSVQMLQMTVEMP